MKIGIALKRIRSALAINQGELSEITGMSISMISAVERDERSPSEEVIDRLRTVLSLSHEQFELICLDDPEAFEGKYRELASVGQNMVLNIVREQYEARKWLLAH